MDIYGLQMEKAMAPHSSTLAWNIPWVEEPGGLQSMGSLGVRHDWATSLSRFTFMHWRRQWQRTPVFLPGESQGQGILAAVSGVTQSRTRLQQLSSSSSSIRWFHLVLQSLGPSMLLKMTLFHSFYGWVYSIIYIGILWCHVLCL